MKSRFTGILTLFIAFMIQFSFAQEKTITGVVTSAEDGLPFPGATVMVDGTTRGTSTDLDGKYSITANQGDKLVFSFIGTKTQTITVGAANTINVSLSGTVIETVVIDEGYRARTRYNTTSAVTAVTAEEMKDRPNVSFLQNMQGRVPGLLIGQSSGQPGTAKSEVLIRGLSSLNGSTDPLYVIDGIPSNATQFRNINPDDIESISVLRDAAGTAIYGNRAANGVLLIKTKQGKYGSDLEITYNSILGFNHLPDDNYKMANSQQLLTLQRDAGIGMGATGGVGGAMTDEEIAAFPINTNWRDVFFKVGTTSNHSLSLRGGGSNLRAFMSVGYMEQEGIVPNTDFKRFSVRTNVGGKSKNEKFEFDLSVFGAHSKRNQLDEEVNDGITNNVIQNPLHGSMIGLPMFAPNQFGTGQDLMNAIGTNFNNGNNIYVLEDVLKPGHMPSWFTEKKLLLGLGASYKITDELSLTSRTSVDFSQSDRVFARAPWSYLAIAVASGQPGVGEYAGFETQNNIQDFLISQNLGLRYGKTFGDKHDLSAGVYTEYIKAHYHAIQFTNNGLNPRQWVPGAGTGYIPFNPATPNIFQKTATAAEIEGGLFSYFGVLDYDYDKKYGFSATLRRDASFRFIEENQWGTFWSFGARWNIDQESFMENSGFDMLKLRVSYGKQGNQNIAAVVPGANPFYAATNLTRDLYNSAAQTYGNVTGITLNQVANRTLMWENVYQFNAGVDFALLNNRLEGNIDVYRKETTDMYIDTSESAGVGVGISTRVNKGSMENKGIEAVLRYKLIQKDDFNLGIWGNLAYNRNRILDLGGEDQIGTGNLINRVGDVALQWNMIPYLGVNPANGNMLFLDADGNMTENPSPDSDRARTGKSIIPVYSGGFGFNADYKGFYLDASFVFFADVWRFDNNMYWYADPTTLDGYNATTDLLGAWTPDNPNATIPSLTASNMGVEVSSDRYLYDASYLRLRNVTLGYNFTDDAIKKIGINKLSLFVTGENMLTWTKWRGFDPEGFNSTTLGGYPTFKTYSFGMNISF